MKKIILAVLLTMFVLTGCTPLISERSEKIHVVASTTMLADLVKNIGQDYVEVVMLLGPEVDPHLALPTASDMAAIENADIVFFNGLDLETQFSQVKQAFSNKTILVAELITENQLITIVENGQEVIDPHVWFSVLHWMEVAQIVTKELIRIAPERQEVFQSNLDAYLNELQLLHAWKIETLSAIAPAQRVLVTPHDAFNYFAKTYAFNVVSIGGLSTEVEISVDDITRVANTIIDSGVKAIFVESSVPVVSVEAVVAQVRRQGFDVVVGGQLFADALGENELASYIAAMKYNVNAIVAALS